MTYNFSKPMKWAEFSKLSLDVQRDYLNHLINKYSVSGRDIANMLGISPSHFSKHCSSNALGITFVSKRVPNDVKERFRKFCEGDKANTENTEPNAEDSSESVEEEKQEVAVAPKEVAVVPKEVAEPEVQAQKPMTMKNFTINYEGEFDPVDLTNSLKFIIGAGTQVELQINCVIR